MFSYIEFRTSSGTLFKRLSNWFCFFTFLSQGLISMKNYDTKLYENADWRFHDLDNALLTVFLTTMIKMYLEFYYTLESLFKLDNIPILPVTLTP